MDEKYPAYDLGQQHTLLYLTSQVCVARELRLLTHSQLALRWRASLLLTRSQLALRWRASLLPLCTSGSLPNQG